jgi:hypothetical protein
MATYEEAIDDWCKLQNLMTLDMMDFGDLNKSTRNAFFWNVGQPSH